MKRLRDEISPEMHKRHKTEALEVSNDLQDMEIPLEDMHGHGRCHCLDWTITPPRGPGGRAHPCKCGDRAGQGAGLVPPATPPQPSW